MSQRRSFEKEFEKTVKNDVGQNKET